MTKYKSINQFAYLFFLFIYKLLSFLYVLSFKNKSVLRIKLRFGILILSAAVSMVSCNNGTKFKGKKINNLNKKFGVFLPPKPKIEDKEKLPEVTTSTTPGVMCYVIMTIDPLQPVACDIHAPLVLYNTEVDIFPQFESGEESLKKIIKNNIKYPDEILKDSIPRTVVCKIIINEDGSVTFHEIVKSAGKSFDKEAERVVKLLPEFSPGMAGGVPVRVYYEIPVKFELPEQNQKD